MKEGLPVGNLGKDADAFPAGVFVCLGPNGSCQFANVTTGVSRHRKLLKQELLERLIMFWDSG